MKPLIYLAHPVSTGNPLSNAHRAVLWVKEFTLRDQRRIYVAPWVAEVIGFSDTLTLPTGFYQRVLDDDCEVVRRLDGLVGVGGEGWTKGMGQERATSMAVGRPVLDWTQFALPNDVPQEVWNTIDLAWREVMPTGRGVVEPY